MQFSVIALLAAFAASASAVPAGMLYARQSCDAGSTCTLPARWFNSADNSHSIECAIALGPAGVGCLGAAVQAGVGMYPQLS
jgi:hypothetical protein